MSVEHFRKPSEFVSDFVNWNIKRAAEYQTVVDILTLFPSLSQEQVSEKVPSLDDAKCILRAHEVIIERFTPVLHELIKENM